MNVQSHLEKITRLESLRGRLDPLQDFELWFWAGMTAGTHAVNAALHHGGITASDDMYPTQPGVYLVAQPDGGLSAAFRSIVEECDAALRQCLRLLSDRMKGSGHGH